MKDKFNNKVALIGVFWSFFDLMSRQGISLLVQIVLARILLPEHFGLIGMIYIFIALSHALVNSGLDQALIREKEINNRDLSTVFFFNFILSIALYTLFYLAAPLISSFYNEQELIWVIRILMLGIIVNAITIIQRVIMIREINFKIQSIVTIVAGISSGSIAIVMAINNFGVWSLVAQQLIMQLIIMILLIIYNKWIPQLIFDFKLFKYYFKFSYKLLLAGILDSIEQNSYHVLIGKLFPAEQLGYFSNAKKISDISAHSFSNAIQRVAYPVLSNLQDNMHELSTKYIKLIRVTAFLYFPLIAILAAIAPVFIPFLLGRQWEPSVLLFQLLSFGSILYPINALNLNILKVVGRSDVFLKLAIIKLLVLIIMLSISLFIGASITTLAIVFIIQSILALIINSIQTQKFIHYSAQQQLIHLSKVMMSVLLMYLIINMIPSLFSFNSLLMMFAQFILGIIVYSVISLIANRWEIIKFIKIVSNITRLNQ